MKQLLRFFRAYKAFSFVSVISLIALPLNLVGYATPTHWLLGSVGLVIAATLLWDMLKSLRSGTYGIDILAATAIITAVVMHEYWTAAIIMIMLTGGGALEDYAQERAKTELHDLLLHAPHKAHVFRKNVLTDVSVKLVQINEKIEIRPGEVVPVDAIILEGTSSFDEANLTGESMPQIKRVGDELLSGSVNIEGVIVAKTLHSAAESQYERIIQLVKSAAASQSPFVRLTDRYSIPFTIISFTIAGLAWFLSGESLRFLQVMVVATPCPLILAAPIAIISGMSRAAKSGIIIKNGTALEQLAAAQTFGFDKTGTLTHGTPKVKEVTAYQPFLKADVLAWAASLEQGSNHVLAAAIVDHAAAQKVKVSRAKHMKELAGNGLMAQVNNHQVLVGRLGLLNDYSITVPTTFSATTIQQTAAFVAVDGELAGTISFTDEVRKNSKTTINRLRQLGIKHFMMVTGDSPTVAQNIADAVGITEVTAQALPADKLLAVEAAPAHPVAFVGDGVNDAPVLTAADVGIALGAKGSTAASESADVVLMLDDISKVADAVAIAKRALAIARQSVLVGIGLSILLMFIFATGKFAPLYGAITQEVVDVIVIFNALRAHTVKLP